LRGLFHSDGCRSNNWPRAWWPVRGSVTTTPAGSS
jgi:hypothetical protein